VSAEPRSGKGLHRKLILRSALQGNNKADDQDDDRSRNRVEQVIVEIQPYVAIQALVYALTMALLIGLSSRFQGFWIAILLSLFTATALYAGTGAIFHLSFPDSGFFDPNKKVDLKYALILYSSLLPGIFVTGVFTYFYFRVLRRKAAAS
jgi:hypothetical protein